jgi:hypothetical protein
MIFFQEVQGVHLVSWFPGVVTFRIPLPLYEILEHSCSPMTLVVLYLLHLILFFTTNKVRWWSEEVWAVCPCFMIWGEKQGVEYRVDLP